MALLVLFLLCCILGMFLFLVKRRDDEKKDHGQGLDNLKYGESMEMQQGTYATIDPEVEAASIYQIKYQISTLLPFEMCLAIHTPKTSALS